MAWPGSSSRSAPRASREDAGAPRVAAQRAENLQGENSRPPASSVHVDDCMRLDKRCYCMEKVKQRPLRLLFVALIPGKASMNLTVP
jgi:hypothetical protein